MSLLIDAPGVEMRLANEAARRGLSAADVAVEILSSHLPADSGQNDAAAPFYATASLDDWVAAFDQWVESHPKRKPLPDAALHRDSIYGGRI